MTIKFELPATVEAVTASYEAPHAHLVGSAEAMVQGGGGHSGSDRNWYRIFLVGE